MLWLPLLSAGQTSFSAMILSIDGEGVVIRNSREQPLQVPQRFLPGDELSIRRGKALIMLFSGEEIPLSAVSYYTIPGDRDASSSEIAALANSNRADEGILAQSGTAYRIRGFGATFNVFPRNTKLLDPENARLRINYSKAGQLDLELTVRDSDSQKVIYEQAHISDTILSLSMVPFEEGHAYYWTIGNTPLGKPELGTIVVPSKDQSDLPEVLPSPVTNFEYMDAISAYYNDKFYFDALELIMEAREKYPDVEIYELMLQNILTE